MTSAIEIADEYMDVLYKLWEGSWDDDAIIADRENNVFADPAKIRPIFHEGTHFKVEGPHLPSPSRQRTPVLFSATASGAGTRFAGKHTEVAFTGGPNVDFLKQTIASIRNAAVAAGRRAGDVKFITQAGIVVGKTEAEARGQARRVRAAVQPRGLPRSREPDVRSDRVPVGDQAQGGHRRRG